MHPGYFENLQLTSELNDELEELQKWGGITSEFIENATNFYMQRSSRNFEAFLKFKDETLNTSELYKLSYWTKYIFAYVSHTAQPKSCFSVSKNVIDSVLSKKINPSFEESKLCVVYNHKKTHSWVEILPKDSLEKLGVTAYIDLPKIIIDFTGIHPVNSYMGSLHPYDYQPYFGKPKNAFHRHQNAYLDLGLLIVYGIEEDFSKGCQISGSKLFDERIDWNVDPMNHESYR